jgi:hypothetical protein
MRKFALENKPKNSFSGKVVSIETHYIFEQIHARCAEGWESVVISGKKLAWAA